MIPVSFDEALHRYTRTDTGEILPPITKIIAVVMQIGSWHHDEDAAMRGTAVHRASHLISMHGRSLDGLHPVVLPFASEWMKFQTEMEYKALWWERYLGSELGYGGTPDTLGYMKGDLTLLEEKTGQVPITVGLQLAGQARLIRENFPDLPRPKRRVVNLPGTGNYKLLSGITHPKFGWLDFDNPIWDQWWFSAVNVYNSGYFKIPEL